MHHAMIHRLFFCLGLCLSAAMACDALAQDERTHIKVDQVAEVTVDREIAQRLPEGRFFADAEALADWWEQAELAEEGMPEVDFEQSILCIQTRDGADPNRVRYSGSINEQGELEIMGITTLIGFQPSDEDKCTFLLVPREGVQAVARRVMEVGEDGDREWVRRVFPLDAEQADADEQE